MTDDLSTLSDAQFLERASTGHLYMHDSARRWYDEALRRLAAARTPPTEKEPAMKVGCPICAVGNLDSTPGGTPIVTRRCEHMIAAGTGIVERQGIPGFTIAPVAAQEVADTAAKPVVVGRFDVQQARRELQTLASDWYDVDGDRDREWDIVEAILDAARKSLGALDDAYTKIDALLSAKETPK